MALGLGLELELTVLRGEERVAEEAAKALRLVRGRVRVRVRVRLSVWPMSSAPSVASAPSPAAGAVGPPSLSAGVGT